MTDYEKLKNNQENWVIKQEENDNNKHFETDAETLERYSSKYLIKNEKQKIYNEILQIEIKILHLQEKKLNLYKQLKQK